MRTFRDYFLLAVILTRANSVHAQGFSITNINVISNAAVVNALIPVFENSVNTTLFSNFSDSTFLNAMGNATSASTRSLGVNPPNEWRTLSLQLSVGAGLESGHGSEVGAQQNSLPSIGLGGEAALTVGLPASSFVGQSFLGLDSSRLHFYADFMTLSLNSLYSGLDLNFLTVGAHADYLLAPPSGFVVLDWTGLQIETGLDVAHFAANYTTPLSFSSSSSGVTMTYSSKVNIGVSSTVVSVPLQMQTGLTFFKVLTLYTGFGMDLNLGSSALTGGVSGPVTATDASHTTVFTGTGTLDVSSTSGSAPSFIDTRFFFGLQFNLIYAHLFAQFSKVSHDTEAVQAGLNLAF